MGYDPDRGGEEWVIPSRAPTVTMSVGSSRRAWANPDSKLNSEEYRQRKSDHMHQKHIKNPKLLAGYSRGKGGLRPDIGIYVRSKWEANYARYLNFLKATSNIYNWEYEPDVFEFLDIKRGCRSYTPDFKIWNTKDSTPHYVEVKGWMDPKSRTKLKRMKKYYPDIRVDLVQKKEYREIKRKLSALIPNWEK